MATVRIGGATSTPMDEVIARLTEMNFKLDNQSTEMKEVKAALTFQTQSLDDIKRSNEELKINMTKTMDEVSKLREENLLLKRAISEIKVHELEDIMTIGEIEEREGEIVEEVVQLFMRNNLRLNNIELSKAHRLGKKLPNKHRPILIKFAKSNDKDRVKANAKT